MNFPKWTVLTNLVSPESDKWIGMSWECFDTEQQAQDCYDRHIKLGNSPTKRPFYFECDFPHLAAIHKWHYEESLKKHEWGIDGMHSNEFCKKCFKNKNSETENQGCEAIVGDNVKFI